MNIQTMVSALASALQPDRLLAIHAVNTPLEASLHAVARQVVCIEGEAARIEKLEGRPSAMKVAVHQAYVTETGGQADYIYASHPQADGFLPVSHYVSVWPNLYEEGRETVESVALREVITDLGWDSFNSGSWLILGDASATQAFVSNLDLSAFFDCIVHREGAELVLGEDWQSLGVGDAHPATGWRIQIRRLASELRVARLRVEELEREGVQLRGEVEARRLRVEELEREGAVDRKQRDEAHQKVKDLDAANQELKARQAFFHEELAKAEGQLELIKDLVLGGGLAGSREEV
jgi:hypothetical protein